MVTTHKHRSLLPLSTAMAALAIAVAVPAFADPLPYGPDTCVQGYVWREARPADTVCVTPAVRDRTAQENSTPDENHDPNREPYCLQGFVWREAFDGDSVCVTPDIRQQTLADNAAAASRKQANQPQPPPVQVGPQSKPPVPPPNPPAGTEPVS